MSESILKRHYKGRFAPSPTGPLHKGSLLTALASYLDAKGHQGQWLVRIEDIDQTRCKAQWSSIILEQLQHFGLLSDEPIVYQTQRLSLYQQAFQKLLDFELIYPCSCSRKQIQDDWAHQSRSPSNESDGLQLPVYSGRCRKQAADPSKPCAWRLHVAKAKQYGLISEHQKFQHSIDIKSLSQEQAIIQWQDRLLGLQSQAIVQEVGDFVVRRADGLFAYQLAVVVDDLEQGITDIVRGQDLLDNTARQLLLQSCLRPSSPTDTTPGNQTANWKYLHVPLVLHTDGKKLSKQNGAQALDLHQDPMLALNEVALLLGLPAQDRKTKIQTALHNWLPYWRQKYIFGKVLSY